MRGQRAEAVCAKHFSQGGPYASLDHQVHSWSRVERRSAHRSLDLGPGSGRRGQTRAQSTHHHYYRGRSERRATGVVRRSREDREGVPGWRRLQSRREPAHRRAVRLQGREGVLQAHQGIWQEHLPPYEGRRALLFRREQSELSGRQRLCAGALGEGALRQQRRPERHPDSW